MSVIDQLKTDVRTHGEVHAIVEEHDDEVEIRQGTAVIDDDIITIDDGQTLHRIATDRVVSWYLPMEFHH